MKDLQEFIKYFNKPVINDANLRPRPEFFPTPANQYLSYSEKDLQGKDDRGSTNALGNINRALNCRIDELLTNWGMYDYLQRKNYSLAEKMKLLSDLGILVPLVRQNINKYHDLVETNYQKPNYENVVDYYGAVSLFVKYTDRLIMTENSLDVLRKTDSEETASFSLDPETHNISLGYSAYNPKTKVKTLVDGSFNIKLTPTNYENYTQALKWWLKALES